MSYTTIRNLQEPAIDIIILTAVKQMMMAKIPKDTINSIRKELETEKHKLLEALKTLDTTK